MSAPFPLPIAIAAAQGVRRIAINMSHLNE